MIKSDLFEFFFGLQVYLKSKMLLCWSTTVTSTSSTNLRSKRGFLKSWKKKKNCIQKYSILCKITKSTWRRWHLSLILFTILEIQKTYYTEKQRFDFLIQIWLKNAFQNELQRLIRHSTIEWNKKSARPARLDIMLNTVHYIL